MKRKLNKSQLLVSTSEPFYVRHARNDKHNEVTVAVLKLAMPLRPIVGFVVPSTIQAIEEVAAGFPDAKVAFNYKSEAPAVLFTVKGKTECRGTDTPDQRIGDAVAFAKAQQKAAVIAERLTRAMADKLCKSAKEIAEVSDYFGRFAEQEKAYIAEEKYMKVLEKKEKEGKTE